MELNEPISVVKNIGETRCKQLNKMGVETVNDLIEYFPRDYEDKSLFVNISDVVKGEVNTFKAKVSFNPEAHRVKGMVIVRRLQMQLLRFLGWLLTVCWLLLQV